MDFILDPSLVLYLPLYELDGSALMSKDVNGHLATVTGAVWTPQGRSFDGVDDRLDIPDSDLWVFGTGNFTIEFWVNPSSGARMFFTQGNNNDTDMVYFDYSVANSVFRLVSGGTQTLRFTVPAMPLSTWTHFVLVRAGLTAADWNIYYNLSAQTKTLVAGDYGASIPNFTQAFLLGARYTASGYYEFFKGTIGEFRIYTRGLSPLEVQRNYLATKWRYQ